MLETARRIHLQKCSLSIRLQLSIERWVKDIISIIAEQPVELPQMWITV